MQPDGPYRFTHALGGSPVGKAWAAIDEQGRFVTVAVLDPAVAATPGWREAFSGIANSLAQAPDPMPFAYADFSAEAPWVAYPSDAGSGAEKLFRALGVEYTPIPTAVSPTSAPPVSSPPQPASGPPAAPWAVQASGIPGQPVSAAPHPVSGAPASPPAAPPVSGVPASPPAPPPAVTSIPPADATVQLPAAQPGPVAPAMPVGSDPFDLSRGRRIAPVSRPPRNRTGLWIGAVALAVVLAGGAGFFAGGALAGDGESSANPSASASPPLYDATQDSLNKAKFDVDLMPLAEPWLSEMGACAIDTEVGGPDLPEGEKRHVYCRYRGVAVHFALYDSAAKKDAARAYRQQMGIIGRALAPGMREATQTTGGVSGVPGDYVEYAGNGHDGRPVCGIWWGRDDSLGALYLETPCGAGLGGNWDALRDLWHRNS